MNVDNSDVSVSNIAAAIAEPARTRMLYCLLDGKARTSTELAIVAGVSPSTASVHLARLRQQRLIGVAAQGKHRYYRVEDSRVASALEALSVIAGTARREFVPNTPPRLRTARTCYDHMAGALAVAFHDRFLRLGWLSSMPDPADAYDLTKSGEAALANLGVDIESVRSRRRRFAFGCLDWSERRPHLGGAVGAALLDVALRKKWLIEDLDSRALNLTRIGKRELQVRFDIQV